MLQSRSLLFDSVWLLLAASRLVPADSLRHYVAAAAATNALRSFSESQAARWADRVAALSLFASMVRRCETEVQRLAIVFTTVSFAAMMFRTGERVLHHMFHYSGFVAISLISGRRVDWVAFHTAIYWFGVLSRASGVAAAAAAVSLR